MDKFLEDFQHGRKEGSGISLQTVDGLSKDDRFFWRTVQRELEEIGITTSAFEANHDFIFSWLSQAYNSGAFEEHTVSDQEQQTISDEEEQSFPANESQTLSGNVEQTIANGEDQAMNTPTTFKPQMNLSPTQTLRKPSAPPVHNKASSKASSPAPLIDDSRSQGTPSTTKAKTGQTGATKKPSFFGAALRAPLAGNNLVEAARGELSEHEGRRLLMGQATRPFIHPNHLDKALLYSCGHGRRKLVYALLKHGANANTIEFGPNGGTLMLEGFMPTYFMMCQRASPLILASFWGYTEIVQVLLRQGADVQYYPQWPVKLRGYRLIGSALIAAAMGGNSRVVEILLAAGAGIDDQRHGLAALHSACGAGHVQTAEKLLENGAEIDVCSAEWGTPLIVALQSRKMEVVRLLIQKGANVKYSMESPTHYDHRTPMDAAVSSNEACQVDFLLKKGAVQDRQEAKKLEAWSLTMGDAKISDLLKRHKHSFKKIEAE